MLKADTEEKVSFVKGVLEKTSVWFPRDADDGIYVDDYITFDEMASIVDYLRHCNSAEHLGELLSQRKTDWSYRDNGKE